jgi:hypothetical protein
MDCASRSGTIARHSTKAFTRTKARTAGATAAARCRPGSLRVFVGAVATDVEIGGIDLHDPIPRPPEAVAEGDAGGPGGSEIASPAAEPRRNDTVWDVTLAEVG